MNIYPYEKFNPCFKKQPFTHQKEALKHSYKQEVFGYFMEMGTGKSKVLLDDLAILHSNNLLNFALIIAPKGVYTNWIRKEIPEHMSDCVNYRAIQFVSNANKTQLEKMRQISEKFDGLTLFVMNVESFSTVKGQKTGQYLAKKFGKFGLIAIDESTTIKNYKAKRTKALCKIAKTFKYRRILTGSPITKSPIDIFSQSEFLRPGILGFESFYGFRNKYAIIETGYNGWTEREYDTIVGFKNLDDLQRRISYFSYRALKKDCLDLPDKIYTSRQIPLTPEQKKMYKSIEEQAYFLFESGELTTAPLMIVQMLRLQQVLSGHLKTEDGELQIFPTNRIEALKEILNEHEGKAIIFSRFRYDIENIVKSLPNAGAYYGATSDEERQLLISDFQNPNGSIKYFVGNPQTAGYGITLTEADLVIFYANDFNLETRIQSEDRAHRIGQTKKVTYVDLITPNTIDEKIVEALRNKIELGAKTLGENAREWLRLSKTATTQW
jgi:SNF2 family DNA or RNA helicase